MEIDTSNPTKSSKTFQVPEIQPESLADGTSWEEEKPRSITTGKLDRGKKEREEEIGEGLPDQHL